MVLGSPPSVEVDSSTPRVEEHSSTPRVEEHSSTTRVEEQVDIPREGLSAVHADIEDLQVWILLNNHIYI